MEDAFNADEEEDIFHKEYISPTKQRLVGCIQEQEIELEQMAQ